MTHNPAMTPVTATTVPVSFRLYRHGTQISRGPLALIAAQAYQAGIGGVTVHVVAHGPGRAGIARDPESGEVVVRWETPLELFPPPGADQRPPWVARLSDVITRLAT